MHRFIFIHWIYYSIIFTKMFIIYKIMISKFYMCITLLKVFIYFVWNIEWKNSVDAINI